MTSDNRPSNGKLWVISGPANSGKFPLAKVLLEDHPELLLVHRDQLRTMLTNTMDEWHITLLMAALATQILQSDRSPLICAWNHTSDDRKLWESIAEIFQTSLIWYDTTDPDTQALIPTEEKS